MIFRDLFQTGVKMANANAPALLTAFGAVGVVTTAVLTAKASFQAAEELRLAKIDASSVDIDECTEEYFHGLLTKTEKLKIVWPLYIGAVTSGAVTVAAVVMAHRVSSRRAAALAAAYALSEGRLEEYQEKVKEKLGIKKERDVRDEIIQDRVNRDYREGEVVFSPLDGKQLIREEYTGRFFWSSIDDVNKAVNEVNHEINMADACTMGEFHSALGVDKVSLSDYMGWNTTNRLEIDWTTCTTPDGKQAVHSFSYVNPPIQNPGYNGSFR